MVFYAGRNGGPHWGWVCPKLTKIGLKIVHKWRLKYYCWQSWAQQFLALFQLFFLCYASPHPNFIWRYWTNQLIIGPRMILNWFVSTQVLYWINFTIVPNLEEADWGGGSLDTQDGHCLPQLASSTFFWVWWLRLGQRQAELDSKKGQSSLSWIWTGCRQRHMHPTHWKMRD